MRFLLTLFLASSAIQGQAINTACCRLDILVGKLKPAEVEVVVVNLNEENVRVVRTAPEFDLRIDIRKASDGQSPTLTALGKKFRSVKPRSVSSETLTKGATTKQTVDLMQIYDLKSGTYRVSISRDVVVRGQTVPIEGKTTLTIP